MDFFIDVERTYSRRELLRKSFWGGLSFLALSAIPTGCARYPDAARKYKFLSPKDVFIFEKVAAVFFPEGGSIPYSSSDTDLSGWADDQFSLTSHETQKVFKIALHVLEISPRLFFFSWRRFSALSIEDRSRYMDFLRKGPGFIKTVLYQFIRVPCVLGFYGHEKVKESIEYELVCG